MPGLVGGHCIGVDPYYLTYKAEELGYHSQIILSGRWTQTPQRTPLSDSVPECGLPLPREKGRAYGRKPEELIAAMEKFLALSPQERAKMGRLGREKMEREFDRLPPRSLDPFHCGKDRFFARLSQNPLP